MASSNLIGRIAGLTVGTGLLVALAAIPSAQTSKPLNGEQIFRGQCAVCHGASGKGDSPAGKSMGVVSFSDPAVAGKSDADFRAVIEKGKDKMPAYGKSLKPEEIQGLVAYIRSLK